MDPIAVRELNPLPSHTSNVTRFTDPATFFLSQDVSKADSLRPRLILVGDRLRSWRSSGRDSSENNVLLVIRGTGEAISNCLRREDNNVLYDCLHNWGHFTLLLVKQVEIVRYNTI